MDSIIKKVKLPNSSTEYGINDVRISTSAISSPTHVLGYNSSNTNSIGSVAISDIASDSDTKNTAGATDTSAQLFLIGATTQGTNPQTYSQDTAYVGTDGCLYSGGNKVITDVSGKADLVSPAFTGTPTAPTAASGTNNTQIATTAFVASAYSSKTASSGGTDVSLVTTGEKYTWNNKQSNVAKLGSTTKPVYTSAAGTFAECSTYAGGTAVTLNGTSKAGTTASFYAPESAGTSGYYLKSSGSGAPTWASFPTIPSKMSDVASITVTAISADTSSSCSITGSGNAGKSQTIIYTNSSGSDKTVTVPTTYKTPNGAAIELTCPNGGYCEVNYLNISGTIYARGL